jgi:hypothetical protein
MWKIMTTFAGIAAAMFVIWALLHPSSGQRNRLLSPRIAVIGAILAGLFILSFILEAHSHR